MKIGILTQPLRNNYGGLLQNYALQQVLQRLGHIPVTVDWDGRYSIKERLWRIRCYLLWRTGILNKPQKYTLTKNEDAIISQFTNQFITKYINHTSAAYSQHSLNKSARNLKAQAFIVGSDQVWRKGYNAFISSMFLDFVHDSDVRRIAYAASFGSDDWGYTSGETLKLKPLVHKFDLVTVRERSGVDLCKCHFDVDAIHVLDPTMLLDREDYEKIVIAENEPKSVGTLFHYILDPSEEKRGLIERLAAEQGLQPFTIMPKCQAENRTKWDVKRRIEDCVFPSVTSWLRGFMDAEMVVVDSFHGAVFSIIFNKPFWVIGNKKRGNARFESLLGMYGLENRMVESGQEIDRNATIDWNRVNEIRQKEQERCMELLKTVLN